MKPSPPKIEFPWWACDETFCPKLYSLSCILPTPIPLRVEEYQGKGGMETKQDHVVPSQVQKPFCVPISFL